VAERRETSLAQTLSAPAIAVAPTLLGAILRVGEVALRITEVEAYLGDGTDPGSHAFRGRTPRNSVMFGDPGRLYVYFTYGLHTCANIVCSPAGEASAVLIRAGEIVEGIERARERRLTSRGDSDLARGPARLTIALGITLADNGADLAGDRIRLELPAAASEYSTSLRTGVSGPGGGPDFPWRFWIPGDPTVSPYKAHSPKKRS
jgi:DNA-3-methyladenine glycosylase